MITPGWRNVRIAIVASALLLPSATFATAVGGEDPFLPATPESQGLLPEALQELADVVRGYLEGGHIAGAELLVVFRHAGSDGTWAGPGRSST